MKLELSKYCQGWY